MRACILFIIVCCFSVSEVQTIQQGWVPSLVGRLLNAGHIILVKNETGTYTWYIHRFSRKIISGSSSSGVVRKRLRRATLGRESDFVRFARLALASKSAGVS